MSSTIFVSLFHLTSQFIFFLEVLQFLDMISIPDGKANTTVAAIKVILSKKRLSHLKS